MVLNFPGPYIYEFLSLNMHYSAPWYVANPKSRILDMKKPEIQGPMMKLYMDFLHVEDQ